MAAAKAGIAGIVSGATATAAAKSAMAAITWGKVAWGAALGAAYNGAQTAINGGSFSDVLKSAAIGAVTGAVGAVVGGGMHVLGDAMGSMLQGGGNIVGTVVHLAAHGAAGGGMSEAMGGSFEDGFIGGVSGAGVAGAFGNAFSGVSEEIGVLGRTAVAAVGGGVASMLSGGKFADGAFSAAFFHLFNAELPNARPADEVRAEANPQWAELFYYPEEGGLWLLNRTTGMLEYVGDFGTGNPGAANWAMQDGGPIPPGTYSIFSRDKGAGYWFGEPGYILDPADSIPFNDVIDGGLANRRSALRFHAGDPRAGQSKGCVISPAGPTYSRLNSILNHSAAMQARAGTTIYRTITQPSWVKNSRSFNNETFFGALTVLRSN